ncbi:hypothetical protein VSS93_32645, partial [Pseudomonas syringae pv. tagetis]
SPLEALGEDRRYAITARGAGVVSGNLIALTFQTCPPLDSQAGFTTRGEVGFLKCRGALDTQSIYAVRRRLLVRLEQL